MAPPLAPTTCQDQALESRNGPRLCQTFKENIEITKQTIQSISIMQGFASLSIIAMVGLLFNAPDVQLSKDLLASITNHPAPAAEGSSPINGYEIVNITWTVQPKIPGALPSNLTGTVQDVWKHINTTWPGYPLPKVDAPPFTTLPPDDHNLTSGYLLCGHFKDADIDAIVQGVAYLRDVPGRPVLPPGPGSCGRVSCSDKSAIYWCNDHDDSFSIDSYGAIADGAHDVNLECRTGASEYMPPKMLKKSNGQIFFDKWNVIVKGDDDHC